MRSLSLSRRQVLRLGMTVSVAGLLAACGGGGKPAEVESGAEATPVAEEAVAEQPTQAAEVDTSTTSYIINQAQWSRIPSDHEAGTLVTQDEWYEILGDPPAEPIVVVGFSGGWGEVWVDVMLEQLEKEHPGVKVERDFDPRIWEKMKPRLVAGDVPDWMYSTLGGWGSEWRSAQAQGLICPVDFLLDVEAYGYGGRLGDIMYPGALEAANGGFEDHQWTMPLSQYMLGIYYNADLFEANGWPDVTTLDWESFMELQEEIAKVIPPWTYAGKYPGYMHDVTTPLMYKRAGAKAWCDLDNLVEGAWLNDDLIWGIEQVQQIFKNGWIYSGSEAMTHTESQQIFVDGKCAMIPNGSWLENEQRATTPEGFRMKFSGVPAPQQSMGGRKALQASLGSADLQVGNGKNPLWGMEVMRMLYSPAVAKVWAEQIGTPLPVVDALAGSTPSDALASALAELDAAEGELIYSYYGSWYPTIGKVWDDSAGDLLWGKIGARELMEKMERAADEVRADPSITKMTRTKDCGA